MWWFFFILPTVLALRDIEPPPPTPVTRNTPVESWLTVRLNHFDASNTETFQMRYLYNSEFANSSNIVIFVGGEWAISAGWVTGGLAHELAQRTRAGLFYTEHRYYGQTRPTRYLHNSEFANSSNIVIFVGGEWAISAGWVTGGLAHELAQRTRAGLFYTEHRYYGQTRPTRYLHNSEFANSSNIVIFVGGEWAISAGWVTGGLAHELAQRTRAGLFYTEHRYYGQTRPTRYLHNSEFANSSNIVIFVGGEWAISAGWVTGGLAHELAQRTRAGLFYTEHRYYGQTRPTRYLHNSEFANSSNIVIFVGGEWAISAGWVTGGLAHELAQRTRAGLFYTEHRYYGQTRPTRYLHNSEFANSSNIVIFVGGEWAISAGWVTGGLAHELAQRTRAGLFYTEHRYYGQTRPTSETSVPELRYLNVDQALGDLAQFIQHVTSDSFEDGRYRNGSVALVGCSYAGSMATWMRLAYPHLITVALSDSGPLHAQEDFPEYLEVITEALRAQGSEACVSSVEGAMTSIAALLATPTGAQRISQLFNTCAPLDATSPLDLATFYWFGITETFAYLVQYATPGDIPSACNRITNTTISSDPVERLAAWITSQSSTQPCIESRYSTQVAAHTNTSYDSPQATMRLWTYQTCVEYGWYQTTSSPRQPFLSAVPLEYFHQMCADFFPNLFDTGLLRAGIARTNQLFAGLTHLPDHVVSVSGGHDPWAPMAPNATHATHLAPVFVVPAVSHCRAIRPTNSSETEELEDTKRRILLHMDHLMTGSTKAGAGRYILSPILIYFAIFNFIL